MCGGCMWEGQRMMGGGEDFPSAYHVVFSRDVLKWFLNEFPFFIFNCGEIHKTQNLPS